MTACLQYRFHHSKTEWGIERRTCKLEAEFQMTACVYIRKGQSLVECAKNVAFCVRINANAEKI